MTKPAANVKGCAADGTQPLASLFPVRSSRLRPGCRFPKLDTYGAETAKGTTPHSGEGKKRPDQVLEGTTTVKATETQASHEDKTEPLALHQPTCPWSDEMVGNDVSTGCGSVASFPEHGDKDCSETSADTVVIHPHSDAEEEYLIKEDEKLSKGTGFHGSGPDNPFRALKGNSRKASDRETQQGASTQEEELKTDILLHSDAKTKRASQPSGITPIDCGKELTSFGAGVSRAAKRRRPTGQSSLTVTTDGSLTVSPFSLEDGLPANEQQHTPTLQTHQSQGEGTLHQQVGGEDGSHEKSGFHIPSPFGLLRKKLFEPLFGSLGGAALSPRVSVVRPIDPLQGAMSNLHTYVRRTSYAPHRRRSAVAVASRLALTKLYPFNRGLKLKDGDVSQEIQTPSITAQKYPDSLQSRPTTLLDMNVAQSTDVGHPRLPWYTLFLPNLADEELGARILFSTDDFFGTAWNLLKPDSPKCRDSGPAKRVTDGWETRRRRCPGHDWCLIELGTPAFIYGIEADTSCMEGNQAPYISIEAANCPTLEKEIGDALQNNNLPLYTRGIMGTGQDCETINIINSILKEQTADDPTQWRDIVSMASLGTRGPVKCIPEESMRNRQFFAPIDHGGPKIVTHLRLNLFPDGGLARLRIYGIGVPTLKMTSIGPSMMNLTAATNGAAVVSCNDQTYGVAKNLLLDTIPQNAASGWLTRRNPGRHPCLECDAGTGTVKKLTGENWVIIKLAFRGVISAIDIDTIHYIGDAPERVLVQAADLHDVVDFLDLEAQSQLGHSNGNHEVSWKPLLPLTRLVPNAQHTFKSASLCSFHVTERRSRPRQRTSNIGARHDAVNSGSTELEESNVTLASPGPGAVTHLKMTIYPDGGVARLRVWGTPEVEELT